MKEKQIESYRFEFPRDISFEEVPEYMERFKTRAKGRVIFDLSGTESFHSSFVGFMIHASSSAEKEGGSLALILSDTAERLLTMMNLLDYFRRGKDKRRRRKSA